MKQRLQKLLPLLLFIAAFIIVQNWARLSLLLNPVDSSALDAGDVVIYATSWCPYCAKTRSFLQAADVSYTEFDIEKSEQAHQEYQRLGGRGVPVVKIGDKVIYGYDPDSMRTAIEQLNDRSSSPQ